ncbi:MAG: hypothetical protein GF405_10005 [Candidatus Eisenbacteria bacterium]|nr:hypothetical protein [Candidatus Eisenbacteria bacterium]
MRNSVIAVLCLLCLAGGVCADLTDSYVMMSGPTEIVPGETYTFTFWVQCASPDGEAIATVHVSFPDGYTLYPGTMAYDEIASGTPSWDMFVPLINHTAIWEDNDGGQGELLPGEGTTISIDVRVADVLYGTPIFWCVDGDGAGAEPHEICGCVQVAVNPVEELSWSAIKSLYR